MSPTRSSSWMWACHPEPARSGGGDAHQIRLHRAGDQHRVGALCLCRAEVELELAHLVAAEGEAGAVVALDPEIDAERRAQARGRIKRRRRVAEPDPREAGDAGKDLLHCGGDQVRCLALRPQRCRPEPAIASGFPAIGTIPPGLRDCRRRAAMPPPVGSPLRRRRPRRLPSAYFSATDTTARRARCRRELPRQLSGWRRGRRS